MKLSHQISFAIALTLAAIAAPRFADATEHVIEMRNQDNAGNRMAFEPSFLKVEIGDTVKFVPTDKGHNAESVPDIWPEGAQVLKGGINKEVVFKAESDGLFVIKCLPHYGMGMVALIQVGKPVNLDKVKAYKALGKSKQRLEADVAKVAP